MVFFLSVISVSLFLCKSSTRLSSGHIAHFSSDESRSVLVEGLITTDPVFSTTVYGANKTDFILEAKKIKEDSSWKSTKGKVKVILYDSPYKFNYGDMLTLEGGLYKPKLPTNPGQFNYREYLERNKIYALLTVKQDNLVRLISQDKGNLLVRSILDLKHSLKDSLYNLLPRNHAALISAMLLGDREDLPEDIKGDFIRSGTMHILATQYRKNYHFSNQIKNLPCHREKIS